MRVIRVVAVISLLTTSAAYADPSPTQQGPSFVDKAFGQELGECMKAKVELRVQLLDAISKQSKPDTAPSAPTP